MTADDDNACKDLKEIIKYLEGGQNRKFDTGGLRGRQLRKLKKKDSDLRVAVWEHNSNGRAGIIHNDTGIFTADTSPGQRRIYGPEKEENLREREEGGVNGKRGERYLEKQFCVSTWRRESDDVEFRERAPLEEQSHPGKAIDHFTHHIYTILPIRIYSRRSRPYNILPTTITAALYDDTDDDYTHAHIYN